MHKTRFGVLVRAATQDREMVGALGVNQALLFTGTLFLGACLAGLGGALQTPKLAANPHMDISVIAEAFVVTVVGGMGSVPGAFLAALLIGQLQAFGILVFPKITLVLVFLLMALVLVRAALGPAGPAGRRPGARACCRKASLRPGALRARRAHRGAVAVARAAGAAAGRRRLSRQGGDRGADASRSPPSACNFLIGVGGIVSFGHAAYFGLGAYGGGAGCHPARRADGAGAARGAAGRRRSARRCSASSSCACRASISPC